MTFDEKIAFATKDPIQFPDEKSGESFEIRVCGRAEVKEWKEELYPTKEEVMAAIRSNAVKFLEEGQEKWTIEDVMTPKWILELNPHLAQKFDEIGITASFEIINRSLTEESEKRYSAMRKQAIFGIEGEYAQNQPKLSDLTPEEHGPVVEISSYYSSTGMAMGSTKSGDESVKWQEDGSVIIERTDRAGGKEVYKKILAGKEAAAKLRDYVKESRVAEMEQVGSIPIPSSFRMTDYSSSGYITFIYDDTAYGGSAKTRRRLDCDSFWRVQSDAIVKIRTLIRECVDTGNCLEEKESEYDTRKPNGLMGLMGFGMVPQPESKPAATPAVTSLGPWKCPECGAENRGKFCANCGQPRPAKNWKCPECGAENEGKFCTNCGRPRP